MHTNEPHNHSREDPLTDLGYETRDIDLKALGKAVVGFFVFTLFCFVVGAVVYHYINPAFSEEYQKQKEDLVIPRQPYPLLQTNVSAKTDIMVLRQAETAQLTSTGWSDASHKTLHIPIDRAMNLLAQRGLPVVAKGVPAISKGNTTDQRREPEPGMPVPVPESDRAVPLKPPGLHGPINDQMGGPPQRSTP